MSVRTSHDCMRDALASSGLKDAEIVSGMCKISRASSADAQSMIDRLRSGGKCTNVLSYAIICLSAERDMEQRGATIQ